jgi:hypothetical protein
MPPSSTNGDVVLRLLDGRSERRELVLEGGRPIPPLSLGSHGGWTIEAGHVASVHVMLAFNGASLFVGAFAGEMALLDGFPLGARWTEVRLPSELRFGSARLSIGRRAGPDEETQLPPDETTRFADARAIAPKAVRRLQRDDEVTRFDDARLQEALRLTRDDEVTCIATPGISTAVMPVVRRPVVHTMKLTRPPTPPPIPIAPRARESHSQNHMHALAPDSERTLAAPASLSAPFLSPLAVESSVMDDDSDIFEAPSTTSSMPPTIPSDGLIPVAMPAVMPAFGRPLPVAVSRPSQPTMAIPEPRDDATTAEQVDPPFFLAHATMDSFEAGALAVSCEHTSDTRDPEPTAAGRSRVSALKAGWAQASLPKKAIAILIAPALVGALFTMRPEPVATARSAAPTTAAVIVAAPQASTTQAAVAPSAPLPRVALAAPGASSDAAKATATDPAQAGAPGLRDTRTAERRALDTAASGQDSSAAEQYEALAATHPENVAFREAARILRERGEHASTQ